MQVVYHTGIQPKEVLALRLKDINLKSKLITLAPDVKEENSNDNNVRRVPILISMLTGSNPMRFTKYESH